MKVTYKLQDTPEKYQIEFEAWLDTGLHFGVRGVHEFQFGEITSDEIREQRKQKCANDTLKDFSNRLLLEHGVVFPINHTAKGGKMIDLQVIRNIARNLEVPFDSLLKLVKEEKLTDTNLPL